MKIKIVFLVLLSLSRFINSVSVNGNEVLSSPDLAHGHEQWLVFHAMPRKLMLNPKVESIENKDLVSYNDDLSGESHIRGGEELPTTTSSKVSIQERSYPTHVFTMDYSPVRRRRPVHNKLLPTATPSP
ncbi:hypothetical protein R6Q59_006570 [Mikania micrantha]|uniref:Uncharacterized protein n=1 Tax=Mikania micrantha TaxID=192012 RepID=A0A5N6PUC7_9ASTR|nr:hypothetical protein E3N88_03965 [Mikania micrantha]